MEQAYNKVAFPIHVRYKSGHVPDNYRIYSGQQQEVHRRYAGDTIWIEWMYA